MASNYHSGRRREYGCQEILERAGYLTIRAAGSKGICDVVAFGPSGNRFISVKSGSARLTSVEREGLKAFAYSQRGRGSVEAWTFPAECHGVPSIEVFK